jgi:hypothetical protein
VSPQAGWTTVGAAVKGSVATPAAPAALRATIPPKPAVVSSKPSTPAPSIGSKPKANGTIDDSIQPSVDFIRWTKTALTGLSVPSELSPTYSSRDTN